MRSRSACAAALSAALVVTSAGSAHAADDEDLEVPPASSPSPSKAPSGRRDPGELALLYIASIGWGGSIAVFVDGLSHANNPYASADLGVFAAVLTAGIGVVVPPLVDHAFAQRRGTAQTVTTAMLIGLGEGIALNEYFSNRATTSFHTYAKDAAWVFGGTTAGLAVGLTVAGLVRTTPGRAAWVATTGLFGGVFAASLAGALSRPAGSPTSTPPFDREGIRNVGIAGALAGAAGVAAGLSTATLLSPSVLRVHLIDLGWILPTMSAGFACMSCSAPDAFTAMAVAGGLGFAAAFVGTMWLPQAGLAAHSRSSTEVAVAPFATPLPSGGFEVGLGGSL